MIYAQVGGGVVAEAEQALTNIGNILAAAGGGLLIGIFSFSSSFAFLVFLVSSRSHVSIPLFLAPARSTRPQNAKSFLLLSACTSFLVSSLCLNGFPPLHPYNSLRYISSLIKRILISTFNIHVFQGSRM